MIQFILLLTFIVLICLIWYASQPEPLSTTLHKLQTIREELKNRKVQGGSLVDLPIYFINLDRATERRNYMENQHEMTRISAIDGKNIEIARRTLQGPRDVHEFRNKSSPPVTGGDDLLNEIHNTYINEFNFLSSAEIACTLSHIKAIHMAYKDGCQKALIMEDDMSFEFVPFWDKKLSDYEVDNWHIIQLHAWLINYRHHYDLPIYKPKYNLYGAGAYLISRAGMKTIIDKCLIDDKYCLLKKHAPSGMADVYIYHCAGLDHRYVVKPFLFTPNNVDLNSQIHDDHTAEHIRRTLKTVEEWRDKVL